MDLKVRGLKGQTDEKLNFDEYLPLNTRYVFRISKFVTLKHNNNFIIIFTHSANCTRILLSAHISYRPKNICGLLMLR